jgi:hypothetical protein
MSGNSSIELSGCSIMSNSSAADAFDADGSSDGETPCVAANGGVQGEDHLDLTECAAPRENVPRASDPYADVEEPDADAEPCQPAATFGGGAGATYTASPGRFCGGMDIRRTVDFEPGVYIIDGGELRINSSAVVTGDDVTFYLRNGAELNVNGAATIQLDAPTSGPTAGLVFFGARDNDASHTLNGGAGTRYTGALYFPDDHVRHNGGHENANGCIQLIADTIDFRGNAGFSADCEGTGVRSAKIPGRVRLTG